VRVTFSPRGFLVVAAALAAIFLGAHLLGWREETRFLSGTPAEPLFGLVYLIFHFAFVLVVPALVLGAGLFFVLERAFARRSPS
jgi:hypothetical protein